MGNCNQCQYFRKAKQQSQILAATFKTYHAEVIQALNKIQEDEQKIRDSEIDFKRNQASANNEYWPYRPIMSDYCALKENTSQLYFICEVKNPPPGDCEDFDAATLPLNSCKDCIHRIPANGMKKDEDREQQYASMAASATIAGASSEISNSLLESQQKSSAERKAFELMAAYHSRGKMAVRPEYLDYCRKLSKDEEYVVCVMNNPWHKCSEWQSWNTESISIELPKCTTSYPEITGLALDYESSDSTILIETLPLFTQGTVKRIVAWNEFLLGLRIPSDTFKYLTELITKKIVSEYPKEEDKNKADEEIQGNIKMLNDAFFIIESPISPTPFFNIDLSEFISQYREKIASDEMSRIYINLYDFYNQPLVPGKSLLSQNMIDHHLEWFIFLNSNLNNQEKGWPKTSLDPLLRNAYTSYAQWAIENLDIDPNWVKFHINNTLFCRYAKYHFKWNEFRTDQWLEWRKGMIESGWSEIVRKNIQSFNEIVESYNIKNKENLSNNSFQELKSQNSTETDPLIARHKQLHAQQMMAARMRQEHDMRMSNLQNSHQLGMLMARNL